jgi:hypothetical protein
MIMQSPKLLRADRLRSIERPFGWIPFRILSSGLFDCLSPQAKLLYFFLCLVADSQGISYYSEGKLLGLLKIGTGDLRQARTELCQQDLLAFDGRIYQLLSLPLPASGKRHKQRRSHGSPDQVPPQLKEILKKLSKSGE